MDRSLESICPTSTPSTVGAVKLPILIFRELDASLLKTPTKNDSMSLSDPWLSSNGTIIVILKLAIGEIEFCWLFCGSKYGSSGEMMIELAIGLAGGKEKTCQTPSFVKAVAKVERSAVTAII